MATCSFAITRHNKKILLVKLAEVYSFAGHWCFPGGVVEPGETLEQSVLREVHEETGVTITVGELFESFTYGENDISIYHATYVGGSIALQESEIADAKWFSVDEALNLPLAYDVKGTLLKYQ